MRYIRVTFKIHLEGKYYNAECVELGTASFGESKEEALQNVEEATLLYLHTLEELSECEQVLKDKGVAVAEGQIGPQPRLPIRFPDRVTVQLPLTACL